MCMGGCGGSKPQMKNNSYTPKKVQTSSTGVKRASPKNLSAGNRTMNSTFGAPKIKGIFSSRGR